MRTGSQRAAYRVSGDLKPWLRHQPSENEWLSNKPQFPYLENVEPPQGFF